MKLDQLKELILQSLEHEKGGVKIYETALKCVINPDLREDWQEYLEQTRNHVKVLTTLCTKIGLKPDQDTPGPANRPPYRRLFGAGDGNGA